MLFPNDRQTRTHSGAEARFSLGLAFERKADAPSYCKETKSEGSNGRFRGVSAACKAGALPAELHAHSNCLILNNCARENLQMSTYHEGKLVTSVLVVDLTCKPTAFEAMRVLHNRIEGGASFRLMKRLTPPLSEERILQNPTRFRSDTRVLVTFVWVPVLVYGLNQTGEERASKNGISARNLTQLIVIK